MDFRESKVNHSNSPVPEWLSQTTGVVWGDVKGAGHYVACHKVAATAGVVAAAGVGALVLKASPEFATQLGDELCAALGRGTALSFDSSRFGEVVAEQGFTGIRTVHPDRFLIRMLEYGYEAESACKAENLIATTRDAIKSGEIKSAGELDRFVEERYHDTFLRYRFQHESMERIRENGDVDRFGLVLRGKHEPYNARLMPFLKKPGATLTLNGTFDGQNVAVTTARLHHDPIYGANRFINGNSIKARVLLEMPTNKETIAKMNGRLEELFPELTPGGTGVSNKPDMTKFGEFEWLSAHRYRERKSVAGITQIKIRAMLESLGYDSPRFKVDVDPNLEALTTDMDKFKAKYGKLFAGKIHRLQA